MPSFELRYFSNALQFATAANIILPNPDIKGPFHVMLLLHGLSDDHTIWSRRTSIERYVDGLPLIVVMPNGGRGFYCDAEEGFAYETAIAEELPAIVENYFPTKLPWCATGLSMGGYGAVKLALKYPDRFKSGHSHSGAVLFGHWDPQTDGPGPRIELAEEFRRIVGDTPRGGPNDLTVAAQKLVPVKRPSLRIDCGTEDFLLEDNRRFHAFLDSIGYEHEYEEFPGSHEWGYWDVHVQEAIAFHRMNLGF
ncbi:MAG: alpha/beta hydrolase family protein [Fimbriimonas sp.]|nr:alpha/beta hydrolase family protein [Fimbriimonas sp.]